MLRFYENVLVFNGVRWLYLKDLVDKQVALVCYNALKNEKCIVRVNVKSNDTMSMNVNTLDLSTKDIVTLLEEPYLLYVNHQTREKKEIPDEKENSVRIFTFEYNDLIFRSDVRTRKVMKVDTKEEKVKVYGVELDEHLYLLTKSSQDNIPVFK